MLETLYIDTETFCETPINCGTHKYAEGVEVMLFAYAVDDGEVQCWDRTLGGNMPADLHEAFNDCKKIVIHNSGFDRTVIRHSMKYHIRPEIIHDTMVQALAHGLPGSLDTLCGIFKVPETDTKDKLGKTYINLFCKPRPKNSKLRRATSKTHPKEWAGFVEYAKRDIRSMRFIYKKMPNWNYKGEEFRLWCLDQKINDRGYQIDVEMAHAALLAIDKEQAYLNVETNRHTEGDVSSTQRRDRMLVHILQTYGIFLPDLQGSTIERFITDDKLPEALRYLLAMRVQASTTSTGKYKKLLAAVSSDGRLRGTMQFCGASRTGRDAGRVFQPQNLPRPTHSNEHIEEGITALKAGLADLIYPDVMKLTSSAVRGVIIAAPGKKLVISDLANIEGRMAAWLAGEDWKLEAFKKYDTFVDGEFDAKGKPLRVGDDLYNLAYGRAFHVDPKTVSKDDRQIGKVMELMLAYAGGVGAFITGSASYGIDLDKMSDGAIKHIEPKYLAEAKYAWERAIKQSTKTRNDRTFGLSEQTYMVCDAFKQMWRKANPMIASYWKELEEAAMMAIRTPNQVVQCRKLSFIKSGSWLRMILPSGRSVCYPSAKIDDTGKITYMGVNQYNRKWGSIVTYGGKLLENACQAVSRDIMMYNMPAVEEAGYEIVLRVHDELVTEAPDAPSYSDKELSNLLATNLDWSEGLPLAAGGFQTYRYKKD